MLSIEKLSSQLPDVTSGHSHTEKVFTWNAFYRIANSNIAWLQVNSEFFVLKSGDSSLFQVCTNK